MGLSFFFYDLETTGLNSNTDRIMQFAGQRTDLELKPIGDPVNLLISLNEDILPQPDAVLIHGISPQQTIEQGLSEVEFLRLFYRDIATEGTIFVGFNNIAFDDEFIRQLNYRNLYDPYRWSYEHNTSRWDIINLARLTRALRPDGVNWPKNSQNEDVFRLEKLAQANKLTHLKAHDALSDVNATIELAKLIYSYQPKLFNYLLGIRQKTAVDQLVGSGQPFVYCFSKYPVNWLHTSVFVKVTGNDDSNNQIIYDLRQDPKPWFDQTPDQLALAYLEKDTNLPIHKIKINSCPAIAPLGVVGQGDVISRLGLSLTSIEQNLKSLKLRGQEFIDKIIKAMDIVNIQYLDIANLSPKTIDCQMYDGFYSNKDQNLLKQIHNKESAEQLRLIADQFEDERLRRLARLYLFRNYPKKLTAIERDEWDSYLHQRLIGNKEHPGALNEYFNRLEQLRQQKTDSKSQQLLEELRLYGESLIPSDIF